MSGAPVAVVGAGGMLGRVIVARLEARGRRVLAYDGPEALDATDPAAVATIPADCTLVVNAAAWTDVDGAESDEEGARRANALVPRLLAERCRAIDATLVHFSTDYVFDGATPRPIPVDGAIAPLGAYGRTKAEGERAVRESGAAHLILRTSWLFAPHGRNFVRTILRLAAERPTLRVIDDQHGRPTSCATLAEATLDLLDLGARGIFHVANGGRATWCSFARAIVAEAGLPCTVDACTTEEYPLPAPRPRHSVLDLSATCAAIGPLPEWRVALQRCLDDLGARPRSAAGA